MTPVVVLSLRPAGRSGLTEYVMGVVRPAGVKTVVGATACPVCPERF
jgi:hypothetical protein